MLALGGRESAVRHPVLGVLDPDLLPLEPPGFFRRQLTAFDPLLDPLPLILCRWRLSRDLEVIGAVCASCFRLSMAAATS